MKVAADGEEEEVGNEEGRNAVVQQVGETDLEKALHLNKTV